MSKKIKATIEKVVRQNGKVNAPSGDDNSSGKRARCPTRDGNYNNGTFASFNVWRRKQKKRPQQ